ncbi:pilus assembly protein [Acinetobacter sp. TUM15509]|uniref:pilus assembly protein n=1 Tax=Acinetobacter sp. TUM15509 TaxID=2609154 RepID=UPI00125D2564|nr:PilC/PilY family type IV pilus protein [Acinetobacter sp. TUM15509]
MKMKNTFASYRQQLLTVSVTAFCTAIIANSVAQASDIDIYQEAKSGEITLMFMLDISGSMGAPQSLGDRDACDVPSNITIDSSGSVASTNGSPTYQRYYCNAIETKTYKYRSYVQSRRTYYQKCTNEAESSSACTWGGASTTVPSDLPSYTDGSGTYTYYYVGMTRPYYDRITRLKDGMFDLLYGNTSKGIVRLSDDKVIGLSTFSRPTSFDSNGQPLSADNLTGQVRIPARKLSTLVNGVTQRQILLNEVAKLGARGGTPTASAYAEASAYLFGTTTGGTEPGIIGRAPTGYTNPYRFYSCTAPTATGGCDAYSVSYTNGLPAYDSYRTSSGYYYFYRNNMANSTASGFAYSYDETKNSAKTLYQMPSSLQQTDDVKKCSGQGIYVLTDGAPNSNSNAQAMMQASLASKSSTFSCTNTDSGWGCMHQFVQNLLDPAKNPANLKFKTAVVGFGNLFSDMPSYDKNKTQQQNIDALGAIDSDQKNAAYWGIIGEGGWYRGNSSQDIVDSVNAFLGNLGTTIPAVTTGSPTVPKDSLNPSVLQKEAYFPQFQPTPDKSYQLWAGNLKKYDVVAGVLKDKGGNKILDSNGRIVNNYDLWSTAVSTDAAIKAADESTFGSNLFALKGGAWSQLKLKMDAGATTENRKLLTNRLGSGTGTSAVFGSSSTLRRVTSADLSDTLYQNDPNRGYLMLLLGYGVDPANPNAITTASLSASPELRQIGAVMHSSPLLITNKGTINYSNGTLSSSNREDYVLFGTTQGLLHIVDAKTGQEKFAFVPNEMIDRQPKAFQKYDTTTMGMSNLYYGIDGAWATYTEYVADSSGNLTVGNGRNSQKGKQIAYGGLRMGGRSYYALDLQNIDNPKLLFQISPDDQSVFSNGSSKSFSQLQYMGESWSKPTIAWVKWNGSRKRVMFVGGGYDAGGADGKANNGGYESDTYEQTNKKGGGVYMFDADNGDLLWWASANATNTTTGVIGLQADDLKYSVVSQIRAEDRDGDGLTDHLYFGDLGGQLFRIDLDNNASSTATFAKAPRLLMNLHKVSGSIGTSPRFYEMPAFSIYDYAGNTFAVISIGSGNRSVPLKDYTVGTSGYDYDAVYNVYDKDVAARNLYNSGYNYVNTTVTPADLANGNLGEVNATNRNDNTTLVAPYSQKGWFYRFQSNKLQSAKVFATPIALNNRLFVSTFDSSKPGLSGDCGAGVKGESFLNQFCMPYGQCNKTIATGSGIPCSTGDGCSLGAGIQYTAIVDDEQKCDPATQKCNGSSNPPPSSGDGTNNKNYCLSTGNRGATSIGGIISAGSSQICLVPQRWYERSR